MLIGLEILFRDDLLLALLFTLNLVLFLGNQRNKELCLEALLSHSTVVLLMLQPKLAGSGTYYVIQRFKFLMLQFSSVTTYQLLL